MVAHVLQSLDVLPLHVAQAAWHGWHASMDVGVPPEHVKPASMVVQSPEQPS